MANQRDRPKLGERYTPKYPRDYPASPSALLPLPYYANLKTVFGSVTACLVFTYLEIHHPSPRDESDRPLNTPITLHLDQISEDLQISRRTLFTALCVLATRWKSEEERRRAVRAGRVFLKPEHTRNGRWKHYSITGAIGYVPSTVVELHRNFPVIARTLQEAGILTLDQQEFIGLDPFKKRGEIDVLASTVSVLPEKESLSEIMLRASASWQARHGGRDARLSSLAETSLLTSNLLKVLRKARRRSSESSG